MRVLIVGAGKVGTFIAADLAAAGHEVSVIERTHERVEQLRQRGDLDHVEWVVADACEVTQLATASPQTADVFVAVTGDDEDNLVSSLLAKQEFGVPRVLARVNHPANEWLFTSDWGVDRAVSAPHLLSGLVQEAVSVGSVVRLLDLAENASLVEVTLAENSPVVGAQISQVAFPREASVVAILRSRPSWFRGATRRSSQEMKCSSSSPTSRSLPFVSSWWRPPPRRPSPVGQASDEQRVGRVPDHHPALLHTSDTLDHDRPTRLHATNSVAAGEHEQRRAGPVVDLDPQETPRIGRRPVLAADLPADPYGYPLGCLRDRGDLHAGEPRLQSAPILRSRGSTQTVVQRFEFSATLSVGDTSVGGGHVVDSSVRQDAWAGDRRDPRHVSRLLRSNITVAAGTSLSRLTGLVRVVVLGYVLGQTALADAYSLANETPNIVYELLLGGVLSATLVPLFSTFDEDGDDESTNVVLTVSVLLMTALTVLAVVAAPLIFGVYSINVADDVDPDLFRDVGTTLARIFLVQILFYGLVSLANAFLNSRRRFFAAAWSPILPNLIIIATLLSLPAAGSAEWALEDVLSDDRLRLTLGLGATLGIASMAVVLIPAMLRTGFAFRPVVNFRHPAVRRLLKLSAWTLGFVAANQISLIVVRNLAGPGSGDASAYLAAFTFFVLPHGLLAVSIATTFQPEMARAVARKERPAFIDQASLGIRMTALLTIPAGVGIFVLRRPIVGALLERGQFDALDAANTSRALAGFALGLGAFSIYMFTLRGFYAHKDTRTPFVINVAENLFNIVLAVLLVDRFGVLGLGLAFALAYVVSSVWALQVLSYKVPGFSLASIARAIAPMVLAAVLMGEAVWLVARQVGGDSGLDAMVRLAIGALVGIVVYASVLIALGAPELEFLRRRLPSRRSTPEGASSRIDA